MGLQSSEEADTLSALSAPLSEVESTVSHSAIAKANLTIRFSLHL